MRFQRREIPQLNSGSMADVAFLLLIFFLITSSLESRTGLYRHLAPEFPEEILRKKTDISDRNIITFKIDEQNRLFQDEEEIYIPEIRSIAKIFIANPDDLDFLPEKKIAPIPLLGDYPVTQNHIIRLEVDRNSNYQTYISVISELTAAYNELREELANTFFGKSFTQLSEEEKAAVREAYPLKISEKERKEESDE